MGSFPLLRVIGFAALDHHLVHIFQDHGFSLSRPITGHSLTASIRRGFEASLSVLLAPPVSSPCREANGGIDLLEVGSSD